MKTKPRSLLSALGLSMALLGKGFHDVSMKVNDVLGSPDRSLRKSAGLPHRPVKEVSLLGSSDKIPWIMEEDALVIDCPSSVPSSLALVFRIAF
jgi:hypothetical protein